MEKMKIMLVDDEERFLVNTQKLLAKKGIDTLTAISGEKALEELQKHAVHVVILDVKMPGMDGFETLKVIKNRYPLVEVIMLTGHATVESAVEGLKAGATDYLIKPADMDELLSKAEEAYEKRARLEDKIRLAQAKMAQKSPLQILNENK